MDLRKVKNDKKEIREKYMAISRTLYTHYITEDREITDIKNNYNYRKDCDNSKRKMIFGQKFNF